MECPQTATSGDEHPVTLGPGAGRGDEADPRPAHRSGDDVTITAGPLKGTVGRVVDVDVAAQVAHLRVWLDAPGGRLRRGLAIVSFGQLDATRSGTPGVYSPVERPTRGRPRIISDERAQAIKHMYATGRYSQAQVAQAHGVSKSTVALLSKQTRPGDRQDSTA